MGFGIPLEDWLRGPLKNYMLKILNKKDLKKQNLFNYKSIKYTLDEHIDLKKNNANKIWAFLMFQLWYNKL